MSTPAIDPPAYQALNVGDFPGNFFDLIPQSAIRVSRFPLKSTHNAIWDFAATPEGRMFASLCNEFTGSSPAQLFEYLPETSELKFCFDTGVETLIGPREIPPSKIHTSINTMRDGRLIMATHTTSPSPIHKYWMFPNYYPHQWEGFPGSHLLVYDPKTGDVRTLGIPVPRDSIYGAIYDPRNHALWFTTFLKAHLWRMDLTTKELRDFGQITEHASWSLARDTEGHIYTSSRSGHLWRVDVDTCAIQDLGRIASSPEESAPNHTQRVLAFHANGPDGRLYFTFHFSDYLYALDPHSLQVERVGSLVPEGWKPGVMPNGMGFDSQGRLWYGLAPVYSPHVGMHVHLVRWDLPGGGRPESAGMLGTPDRVPFHLSEVVMDAKRDLFYLADTNQQDDHPVMLAVDLKVLERDWHQPRVQVRDANPYMLFKDVKSTHLEPDFTKKAAALHRFSEGMIAADKEIFEELNDTIRAESIRAVRVWEHLGRGSGSVRALRWETDGTLRAWCGGREGALSQGVVIRDGKLESVLPLAGAGPEWKAPDVAGLGSLPAEVATAKLPSRQGRRHLAKPSCWAPWSDGWALVGTLDGMVAKVQLASGRVVALGVASPHGPVHQIVTNAERTRAFGVAGDTMDLGQVVYYDEEGGLREIGRTLAGVEGMGLVGNTEPSCAALSPDGKTLAIGALDELGSVYLYREPVTQ